MGTLNAPPLFDYHSHILPGIDDGSRDVKESLALLRECAAQGVVSMAATSHFYAFENAPSKFLEKRDGAWKRLKENLEDGMPEIRLGAEVHYFEGISRTDEILKLRLEGSSLLLLEMPMSAWPPRMIDSVLELNAKSEVTVLLAHIERYMDLQKRGTFRLLYEEGVYMQCNASFFLEKKTRKKAMKMLAEGKIHALGSDCHNMQTRPPRLGPAKEAIEDAIGVRPMERLKKLERILLG